MRLTYPNFAIMRWSRSILVLFGAALMLLVPAVVSVRANGPAPAVVLHLDGAVGPAIADYVTRGLQEAADRRAPLVILQIDTPGGLDSSMRGMIRAILASPVPVATYVNPSGARAASAGTFILYASHIAAMAPGTNLGAATPVQIGAVPSPQGAGDEPRKGSSAMEAKATNDAAAFIRSLAELHGRNADWGERAVRNAASLSASAALKEHVIDIVARDQRDLLRQMNGRVVAVHGRRISLATAALKLEDTRPDWRTRLLAAITDSNVALLLMMIGIYGLIFEFMSPGAYLPGTLGAICLLTGLYALAALPVNYAGLALIMLGIAMLVGEAFTFSHGILGAGGVVAFALGASILVDVEATEFRISRSLVGGLSLASAAIVLVTARTALGARRRKVVSGADQMVGASGTVQDWQGGRGHVFVHGERWSAAGRCPFNVGQSVRVIGLRALTLDVEPDPPQED